ncbi:MFS transporter [Pseudomonas sp. S37]|uniref:MFS transporter n=1 Tax=Pseudomonas sp. S37 TaxID=2767449 RepID=UPI001914048A|nr:MFS transporter [Pseudomonas sp. S37]MBK4992451.1 MFS transporter [Pseudomonas sp. S37]
MKEHVDFTSRSIEIDSTAGTASATRPELKRVVCAAVAGSIIEWFEFSVYGYLAAVMGKVFFSSSTPAVQIIASLAAFAIAFLARPFGGIICGALGDRLGRKQVLNMTLFVMALSTFAIGLIPSHETIGIAAPILLVVMRLLQGLSAGGEVSAAAIYVAEHCDDRHRTLMTGWVEVGAMAGFLMGALAAFGLYQVFTDDEMLEWAWRIPFYFAAPLALIGLYIRRRLEESPLFIEAQSKGEVERLSIAAQIARLGAYKSAMLQAAGMVIVTNITLFTVLSYLPTYLSKNLNLSSGQALAMSLAPMTVLVVLIPFLAALADRIGRRFMMILGSIGVLVLAIPCFKALGSGDVVMQVGALVVLNVCLALLTACIFAQVPSLFPTKVRFMGMAISYNVTIALFAGTAPMINAWLTEVTGNPVMPAYYMMFGAVIGLWALLSSKDRTGQPMAQD